METLQFIHSGWAYIVLLVLVIATFNALIKFFSGKEYSPVDFRFSLFALITMHIQLLIGIILFLLEKYYWTIRFDPWSFAIGYSILRPILTLKADFSII